MEERTFHQCRLKLFAAGAFLDQMTSKLVQLAWKGLFGCLVAVWALPAPAGQERQIEGQKVFSSTCAACHGLDGRGGEHAPNIATDGRISAMTDASLTEIVRKGIPAGGMPGFASSLSGEQISGVVAYLRTLQGAKDTAGPLAGNAVQGRKLFFGTASCAECHVAAGKGGTIGPELTGYGKLHSPAAIRQSILEPNKNIDPRRGPVTVTMASGKSYRGMVRNEDNFSLQMQTVDGDLLLVNKTPEVRIERARESLMPSNYASRLSSAELDDIVKFLSESSGAQQLAAENDDDQE